MAPEAEVIKSASNSRIKYLRKYLADAKAPRCIRLSADSTECMQGSGHQAGFHPITGESLDGSFVRTDPDHGRFVVAETMVHAIGTSVEYKFLKSETADIKAYSTFHHYLNEGGGKITKVFRAATQAATQFADGLNMMAKGEEKILGEKVNTQMEAFVARLRERGITDVEELRQAIFEEGKRVEDVLGFYQDKVGELGGAKKVQKKRGTLAFAVADAAQLLGLDKPLEKLIERDVTKEQLRVLADYQKALDKFRKMEGLEELFGVLQPTEAPPEPDGGKGVITPTKAVKKQIATITGAAPKTFNINIDKLIETMEISTTNLQESTVEIKQAVTRAMGEALADVEPITQ